MKIRVNNILPLAIVLFLAGLTLWLRQAAESPQPAAPAAARAEPDAIVENLTIRTLGESGAPQYAISAKRMLHYAENDATELFNPLLTKSDVDGTRVSISADKGSLDHENDTATFSGRVMVRQNSPRDPELLAQSDYMQVLSKQDLIRTNRPVTITQGTSTLSGVGMEIRRHARQFTLHSQVKGSYIREKK